MQNIPIFLASDSNYAPFVATTIASICDNTKEFLEFYVLDSGISDENRAKIEKLKENFSNFSLEFLHIDLEKEFSSIKFKNVSDHVTLSAYNRFLIPKLKPEIKKAIYMDVDIIALGDIAELWNEKIDKTLGWILEQSEAVLIEKVKERFSIEKYYNSGVLLIDFEKWIENDYTSKVFDIESKYRDELEFADQDILNLIFKEDCCELNSKYNVQYSNETVILRHFVNVFKPWKSNYFKIGNKIEPLANFDDFWKYAKMTEFHEELQKGYEESINATMLTKRMSIIADKMRMAQV